MDEEEGAGDAEDKAEWWEKYQEKRARPLRKFLVEQFVDEEQGEESSGDNRAEEKVTGSVAKVRGLLAAQGATDHHKNGFWLWQLWNCCT